MGAGEPEERLTQRELRNDSGRVLREVATGKSFVLTNAGTPVAKIIPIDQPAPELPIVQPARRKGRWSTLEIMRKNTGSDITSALDALREDRL